jgi:hypothetical protein
MSNYNYTAFIPPNTDKFEEGKTYHWAVLKHFETIDEGLKFKDSHPECTINTYSEYNIGEKVA